MQDNTEKDSDKRTIRLPPSDNNVAMVHLYRAEITRAVNWRNRLDVTTNWALVATGAAISFAFGQESIHHSVIILSTILTTLFLFIEGRRYRYYELWSYRTRLMETDFFAPMLVPPFQPGSQWSNKLAESLLNPQFPISIWEALGRRLRRNYLWIYLVLFIAWLAKLLLYADLESVTLSNQLLTPARMGVVPGWLVMTLVIVFYAIIISIAVFTRRLRHAAGEVFPAYRAGKVTKTIPSAEVDPQMNVSTEPAKTYSFLAIVTSEAMDQIAADIESEFKRPASRLAFENTSGGQTSLLLPVTITEIPSLKGLVEAIDEQAVVVAIPANDVFLETAAIQEATEPA